MPMLCWPQQDVPPHADLSNVIHQHSGEFNISSQKESDVEKGWRKQWAGCLQLGFAILLKVGENRFEGGSGNQER